MQFWSRVANIFPKDNNANISPAINNAWVPEFKSFPDHTTQAILASRRITEEKVEPILRLLEQHNVTRIDLFNAKFPDKLIEDIAQRLKIIELDIGHTRFRDDLLPIIAAIPTLKIVYAVATDLTPEAEKKFYSLFPAGREHSVRLYCK